MLPGQSIEGKQIHLTLAAKLTKANATQVEALNKYRGKGTAERPCGACARPSGRPGHRWHERRWITALVREMRETASMRDN
jgi:hypothetical protein